MAFRKPISKKLRFEVLQRDGYVCRYCGHGAPSVVLHIDHVVPVAHGGTNELDNLVTACEACNNGKRASFHDSDLAEIVRLKKRVEELQEDILVLRHEREMFKDQALPVAENIVHTFDLDLAPVDFNFLWEAVFQIGSHAALAAFNCAEYEVGSNPEDIWCCAVDSMRRSAAELGVRI